MNVSAVSTLLEQAHRALPGNVVEAGEYLARARTLLEGTGCPSTEGGRTTAGIALKVWQLGRIDRFIEEHIDLTVRIDELAAAARLSRSHFSRAFHSTVGETPAAYLRRRRVERAQHLMLTTRRSLSQIAVECGMSDQSHMTRLFRVVAGTTPALWRRRNLGRIAPPARNNDAS